MKKEIVILSRSLPHHGLGGMEVVAWDLALEFSRLNYPVRVITTSLPGQQSEFQQDGVQVVPLSKTPSGRYSRAWWRESRRYFIQHCMDTTQGVLSVSAAAFALLTLKGKLPDVPFVMQAHGTSWGEVISKWRSKRLRSLVTSSRNMVWIPKDMHAYSKFDAVVAVGDRVRMDLTRFPARWFLPEGHVHLIYNGIDISKFHPCSDNRKKFRERLGISEVAPVIISASRLHAQKGLDHGLESFSLLLDRLPGAVYLVAGDGPERERLELLANKLGIIDKVHFLGALERSKLAQALQASDVFLFLTERVEVGVTLNVMEALACGLPCVVSDNLNFSENAYISLVSPGSKNAVVEAMVRQHSQRSGSSQGCKLPDHHALHNVAYKYLQLMKLDR